MSTVRIVYTDCIRHFKPALSNSHTEEAESQRPQTKTHLGLSLSTPRKIRLLSVQTTLDAALNSPADQPWLWVRCGCSQRRPTPSTRMALAKFPSFKRSAANGLLFTCLGCHAGARSTSVMLEWKDVYADGEVVREKRERKTEIDSHDGVGCYK